MRAVPWGAWLAAARRSSAGGLVRRVVPLGVRRRGSQAMVRVLPPGSALAREARRGLRAPLDDPGPAGARAPRESLLRAEADPAAPRPRLVLLVGLHRSGTSALDAMLTDAFPALHVEGELFYGVLTPEARAGLIPKFPWVDRSREAAVLRLTGPALEAHEAEFRARMAEQAPNVVRSLLARRSGTTTIKVLDGQLREETLSRILEEFRPLVITISRAMLFSLASRARAQESGSWRDVDSSSVDLAPFDEAKTRDYIRRARAWHAWWSSEIDRLGLSSTTLTYTGLLETGTEVPLLREAFAHLDWRPLTVDRHGRWISPLTRQDRRTDHSVLSLLAAIRGLPPEVRDDLLRLPDR